MTDYYTIRRTIVKFLNESGISAYDLCRVGKDLCCCGTCKFYVQHYAKGGEAVDFGHCRKNKAIKATRPHDHSCGFWTMEEDNA